MTAATCHGCGVPLPASKGTGRPRKWCGERCRKAQYGGACVDCGAATSGSDGCAAAPEHCAAGNPGSASVHAQRRASRDARRRAIESCWLAELPLREIAVLLGTTPESIGVSVSQMRRDGYDLPYRKSHLASPAEKHGTRADGPLPSPSRGAGPTSPAGAGAQPLTHNGGAS